MEKKAPHALKNLTGSNYHAVIHELNHDLNLIFEITRRLVPKRSNLALHVFPSLQRENALIFSALKESKNVVVHSYSRCHGFTQPKSQSHRRRHRDWHSKEV